MSGKKGNIGFFSRYFLNGLGIAVAWALLISFFQGRGSVPLRGFFAYLSVIGGFVQIILQVNGYQLYFPMILSFGCTRKRFLLGMQLGKVGYGSILLLLSLVGMRLFSVTDRAGQELLFSAVILLLSGGGGDLVSAVYLRFHKLGTLFTVCVFGAMGICVGIFAGSGYAGDIAVGLLRIGGGIGIPVGIGLGVLWLLGSLAVYLAAMRYEYRN